MKKSSLYGLVLAGGRSRRMGSDKGLINYHGKPQREFLFELLEKFCDKVYTSCRIDQHVPLALNPVQDKFDFESPLNGILSAFEMDKSVSWLAIAVDLPFVNQDVLQFLIVNRDKDKVATCFYDSGGQLPEPLIAIWERSSYSLLKEFHQQGNISPREFLIGHDTKKLFYPDSKIHININTPEDRSQLI